MNNQLKATIITKNSKDITPLTAKRGELVVDYENETKPTIKVGPAETGAKAPVELYAKCEQITNSSGVKISESETEDSTFGNMKSTVDGIDADSNGLTNLGMLTLAKGKSYGTSLPEGTEGRVFFLIQSK